VKGALGEVALPTFAAYREANHRSTAGLEGPDLGAGDALHALKGTGWGGRLGPLDGVLRAAGRPTTPGGLLHRLNAARIRMGGGRAVGSSGLGGNREGGMGLTGRGTGARPVRRAVRAVRGATEGAARARRAPGAAFGRRPASSCRKVRQQRGGSMARPGVVAAIVAAGAPFGGTDVRIRVTSAIYRRLPVTASSSRARVRQQLGGSMARPRVVAVRAPLAAAPAC
jgi:hypothetical protein